MKFRHILEPVTDGGKLAKFLRNYQFALATRKEPTDPKCVADTLLWLDAQNAKLGNPSKRAAKLIAAMWAQYCGK